MLQCQRALAGRHPSIDNLPLAVRVFQEKGASTPGSIALTTRGIVTVSAQNQACTVGTAGLPEALERSPTTP